jgi:hypothetical protein
VNDDQSTPLPKRPQAVGEAVTADGVEDDVDATTGELLSLVLPRPVGAEHLIGAGGASHGLLLVAGDDRECPRAEPFGDLECRGPDATGRAVDEHALALGETPAQLQREVRGVVVEHERGALLEVELIGQLEAHELGRHRDLGKAADHAERGDAVAGREGGRVGRRADDPADLAAGDERQRWLDLILAARLEHLGERDSSGLYVDHNPCAGTHHVARFGVGEVRELQRRGRAGQLGDLKGAHPRSGP